MIVDACTKIFQVEPSARVKIIKFDANKAWYMDLENAEGLWLSNSSAVSKVLSYPFYAETRQFCSISNAYRLLSDADFSTAHDNRFVFTLTNGNFKTDSFNEMYVCNKFGVNFSMLYQKGSYYESDVYGKMVLDTISKSGGIYLEFNPATSCDDVYRHVTKNLSSYYENKNFIIPTTYHYISLSENLVKDGSTDTDGDGLTDWEEIDNSTGLVTFDENGMVNVPTLSECINLKNTLYYVMNFITRHPLSLYYFDKIKVLPILSDPTMEDTDNDGISDFEDTAPFEKGIGNGIIGEISIVSYYKDGKSFASGHSFLVYKSYINDTLDFSGFYSGYEMKSYGYDIEDSLAEVEKASDYSIKRNKYVTLGNAARNIENQADIVFKSLSGCLSGSLSEVNGGTWYNWEVCKAIYDGRYFSPNSAITYVITKPQLETILDYHKKYNYYNLFTNNCTKVAAESWNLAFDDNLNTRGEGISGYFYTPQALKLSISERPKFFEIDMLEIAGEFYG